MPRNDLIQIRRDTAANWTSVNPTLAAGEMGLETDTDRYKIGNGTTPWNALSADLTVDRLIAGNQVEGDVLISYNQADIGTDLSVGNDLEVANNATISGTSNIIGGVFLGDGIVDADSISADSLEVTDDITCGDISLPRGVMSFTPVTTSDFSINSNEETQVTGASFTAVANRYYKITYFEPSLNHISGGDVKTAVGRIRLTNVNGAIQQTAKSWLYVTNEDMLCVAITTLPAGTVTLVGTLQVEGSPVTMIATRSSTQYAFLLVEDIGAVNINSNN